MDIGSGAFFLFNLGCSELRKGLSGEPHSMIQATPGRRFEYRLASEYNPNLPDVPHEARRNTS